MVRITLLALALALGGGAPHLAALGDLLATIQASGGHADPNGATVDAGTGYDPNGATADAGGHYDPNG